MKALLAFLTELDKRSIYWRLNRTHEDAIMVEIAVPSERWEVEFKDDGTVEVEVFRTLGMEFGDEAAASIVRLLESHA